MEPKPLRHIRVLEIAAYISGPYAASFLAALGADVVKIEPPQGDPFRIGKDADSPYFAQYNAGKKSVALDLKAPGGGDLIRSLLPHFDVLIENMRPGKLGALGLGADACRDINPRLVYASVSGFGSGGPLRDRPAYDTIGQSLGGLYTVMNDEDDVRLAGTCFADLISGITTATGVLAALVAQHHDPNPGGIHLETSVFEAVSTLTIDAMTQAFETRRDPVRDTRHSQAQNFCLKTASGDFIALHLSSSQKFWRALVNAIGREDLLNDPRFQTYEDRTKPAHFSAIRAVLEQEFMKRPRSEWEQRLSAADVPSAPALKMREVAAHPQMQWLELSEIAANGSTLVRPPWRFDGNRPHRGNHVPRIGEHTRQVLSEVRSQQELDRLAEQGTISAA